MKRIALVGLVVVLAAAFSLPAFAWEFSMKGDWECRYRYWTRTGVNDIFGEMNSNTVDLGINHLVTFPSGQTTNRLGSTIGVMAGQNRFGSEMSLTELRMTVFPKIKINKAIDLEASVNLTSLGIWSDGQPYAGGDPTTGTVFANPAGLNNPGTNAGYINSLYVPINDRPAAVNVPNTYMTVQWLKASIQTPSLNFSLGYKTSAFGIGLWKHNCNRSSTSFSVTAPYGPLKLNFSPYFGRDLSAWALNNGGPFDSAATTRMTGDSADQRQVNRRNYFRAFMGEVSYAAGNLECGLLSDSYYQPDVPSVAPAGRGDPFSTATATQRPLEDIVRYRLGFAWKYTDGRFFFDGEVDWFNRWRSGRGTADPSNGTAVQVVRQNRDNAGWLYALEVGAMAGPSRLTLNYARATGDDPSTRHTSEDAATSETGLTSCYMKEWAYLMYYMYGTGDGWDAAGYGQPTNFHHIGGKLDYAVAANLNLGLVYAYSWRDQPNAYRLGGNYRIMAQQFTNDNIAFAQGIPIPGTGVTFAGHAVPDSAREIGWEVDFVVNWKLLEGLTWNSTFAYWKPGNWWSYAFPNSAWLYRVNPTGGPNANPNTAAGELNATFNLGRDIDALFAVETNIIINF